MFLWRPVMEELASALPIGGGLYAYLCVPYRLNIAFRHN